MTPICRKCGSRPVEVLDDWVPDLCPYCADRTVECDNVRKEWDHYHPGEPCPESELP